MTGKVAASPRSSRIASTLALLMSFAVPFVWGLSTGLVWDVGKQLSGNASDVAISFPQGIPLVAIILVSWLACFMVFRRFITSRLLATLAANVGAILVLCACMTFQFGVAVWNPVTDDELNVFPIRFAFAVLIAFVCSAFAALYLKPRLGTSAEQGGP